MNTEDFKKLLDNHDWYYSMSSDPRSFTRGLSELNKIKEACNNNAEFEKMYQKKYKEIFHGKKQTV